MTMKKCTQYPRSKFELFTTKSKRPRRSLVPEGDSWSIQQFQLFFLVSELSNAKGVANVAAKTYYAFNQTQTKNIYKKIRVLHSQIRTDLRRQRSLSPPLPKSPSVVPETHPAKNPVSFSRYRARQFCGGAFGELLAVREDGTQREVGVDKVMVNQEGGKIFKRGRREVHSA